MLHGMFFPTCQMVLESITWPQSKQTYGSDDRDDEISDGTVSLISGFLQTFVEEGTSYLIHINLNMQIFSRQSSNHVNKYISAVKLFKYLIAINRINDIVNSRLIAHFYVF